MPTTVYPESLIGKYSNIKIVFLPKSTISHLQSLDAGIIKNFKVKYRKKLMRYVLARIVNDWNANEIANGINVIRVIDWIKELGMKYPKTPLKIALQVVALWSNLLVLMTTNMPIKNLIISPKNYLRSCKTTADKYCNFHFHPTNFMRLTGDVFSCLPASRNMVLLTTVQSKIKATTTVMKITKMKAMYLR